ncbi:hypothetical protein ZIOFF_012243 [Zingiber officinale]|uniref:Uncharacterized protein n=1 Tax=Zingiber officinale TaxID=94328 RepID=A0A8J5HZQ6_ZINOF|nr:hypothetical protein ZIOFF_012243 [Zingiber officinale]
MTGIKLLICDKKAESDMAMDRNNSTERGIALDLESCMNSVKKEQEGVKDIGILSSFDIDAFLKPDRDRQSEHSRSSSSEHSYTDEEALVDKRVEPEENVSLLEKKIELEKPKKKGRKKPPKPSRPPNSPPLDATNQKLMKEIEEIARLMRERIQRMKIKMKNAKSTHSNSSLWALLVTILFILARHHSFPSWCLYAAECAHDRGKACYYDKRHQLVILMSFLCLFCSELTGVYSRGSYRLGFYGTPESSAQSRGGFVSIQFYKNVSANLHSPASSASPKYVP